MDIFTLSTIVFNITRKKKSEKHFSDVRSLIFVPWMEKSFLDAIDIISNFFLLAFAQKPLFRFQTLSTL